MVIRAFTFCSLVWKRIAHGGRFLARGIPVKAYEFGLNHGLVVIEFESVQQAIEASKSPEYQAALAILRIPPRAMCG